MKCPICLNTSFYQADVLKPRLIKEWELNEAEVRYINRQQGYCCQNCHANLRSMTIAYSFLKFFGIKVPFNKIKYVRIARKKRLLELNQAGNLHYLLSSFKKYVFASYPIVDMQKMPYEDESFDIIVHSDTLEHVENSVLGLKECYRILDKKGVMFYTIPIVYGRLSRRRDLLDDSFHGEQDEMQGYDYKVWTEYGSDFWVEIIQAGFQKVTLNTMKGLSSIVISAEK
jgi:SAM-dependent methyltransferase